MSQPFALGAATWPGVGVGQRPLLVVPIGSCEQHGPHLPLDTDTRIAVALAGALAERRPDVWVAPAVSYGASGEHQAFPGTLSIGQEALERLLVELGRSALPPGGGAFRSMVLVNGHGGNAGPVARAARTLADEGRRVLVWAPAVPGGDAHAGRVETSILLALAPHLVRLERAEPGSTRPLAELLPALEARGVRAVSPNGVLGDPSGSTAEEGRVLLERLSTDLTAAVAEWVGSPD